MISCEDMAIVPPLSSTKEPVERAEETFDDDLEFGSDGKLHFFVRVALIVIVVFLVVIFGIAIWLKPYNADGTARIEGTHTQMGLKPCTFKVTTGRVVEGGLPCPSCGMTTSFALLMEGDLVNSCRANFVGTMLALVCLVYIPWAVISVHRGRPFGIKSMELTFCRLLVGFVVLMMIRWVIVIVIRMNYS